MNRRVRTGVLRLLSSAAVLTVTLAVSATAQATPGWTSQPTTSPSGAATALFHSVSCPTTSFCLGVGTSNFTSSTPAGLYATSDGRAWMPDRQLLPTGAASAGLIGVSCVSPTFCVAVGDFGPGGANVAPLAEHWDGSGWTQKTVPMPRFGSDDVLFSVSCTSADSCFAVGGNDNGPLAEHWDGSAWTLQAVVATGSIHAGRLTGVSCVSATSCTAVGSYLPGSGTDELPLVAHLAGSEWNLSAGAGAAGATSTRLEEISCPSSASCLAVGFAVNGTGQHPFITHWNGTTWNPQAPQVPSGATGGDLASISCTSVTACTAVGSYQSSGSSTTLAERWNGSSWVLQPVAAATGASAYTEYGVSCPTDLACTAVGATTAAAPLTAAAQWGGPAWATLSIPAPPTMKSADLFATSCPNANWCVAVGQYDRTSDGRLVPFAEYWNGSAWRILPPVTLPSAAGSATLLAVSCPVVRGCVAVGAYTRSSDGVLVPLLVSWNGSAWGAISAAPVGTYAQLEGVSCTTIHACEAVGLTFPSGTSGFSVPLAEALTGTSAAVQRVPAPPQNAGSGLHSVSCDASLNCVAVGNRDDGHGEKTLTYHRAAGGAWSTILSPNAGDGAGEDNLFGVSCVHFNSCVAAGVLEFSHETPLGLTFNGIWTDVSPAAPAGGAFKAISCPTITACTAVGYDAIASTRITFAERWDGTRWSHTPTVSPGSDDLLFGVSCPTTQNCMSVGAQPSTHQPLAEIYS